MKNKNFPVKLPAANHSYYAMIAIKMPLKAPSRANTLQPSRHLSVPQNVHARVCIRTYL